LGSLLGSPIFGSDEYAYFISGKFIDQLNTIYQLDPGLQQVSNILFFNLYIKFLQSRVKTLYQLSA